MRIVDTVDPAMGRRTFTRGEFAEGSTGLFLELRPTPAFERRKRTSNPMCGAPASPGGDGAAPIATRLVRR